MRIICDVDYVVLNSKAVKAALARAGAPIGIGPSVFYSAYRRLRQRGEWSPEGLSVFLPERFQKRKTAIMKKYWKVIDESYRYLYQDAKYFFEWCDRKGHSIVLYTYGHSHVQQRKVMSLKRLLPDIEVVFTTDRSKRRDLKKCLHNKNQWVWLDDFNDVPVNDRAFRGGTLLYVKRSASQPKIAKLPVVKNLYEAKEVIETLSK